jgi:hypothetical protein
MRSSQKDHLSIFQVAQLCYKSLQTLAGHNTGEAGQAQRGKGFGGGGVNRYLQKISIPMDPSTFLGIVWGIIYYNLEG